MSVENPNAILEKAHEQYRIPKEISDQVRLPALLEFNQADHPFVPGNAQRLLLDVGAELSCGDVVMTLFKNNPEAYFINKLGLGILPRECWSGDKCEGLKPIATFVSHEDDSLFSVCASKIMDMQKITFWQDQNGKFHPMEPTTGN